MPELPGIPDALKTIGMSFGLSATDTLGVANAVTAPLTVGLVGVVSSAAPNNADGRPDGTIYIQTA